EIEAILHAAGGDGPLALRDRALLEFLYGTGARISEAVGAATDDLDLDDGSVLLHGKGGRSRLVPVGGYARTAVSAYLVRARPELVRLGHGTPAVFVNARGGPLSRQSAWTILRRAAGGAGLDPAAVLGDVARPGLGQPLVHAGQRLAGVGRPVGGLGPQHVRPVPLHQIRARQPNTVAGARRSARGTALRRSPRGPPRRVGGRT